LDRFNSNYASFFIEKSGLSQDIPVFGIGLGHGA
jgi:hypothetical protein